MERFKNYYVLVGTFVALVGSIIWGVVDGGFEPWIVAIMFSVALIPNFDLLPFTGRKKRNLTPEQKIAARDK